MNMIFVRKQSGLSFSIINFQLIELHLWIQVEHALLLMNIVYMFLSLYWNIYPDNPTSFKLPAMLDTI